MDSSRPLLLSRECGNQALPRCPTCGNVSSFHGPRQVPVTEMKGQNPAICVCVISAHGYTDWPRTHIYTCSKWERLLSPRTRKHHPNSLSSGAENTHGCQHRTFHHVWAPPMQPCQEEPLVVSTAGMTLTHQAHSSPHTPWGNLVRSTFLGTLAWGLTHKTVYNGYFLHCPSNQIDLNYLYKHPLV